jgi:hypothetical protein
VERKQETVRREELDATQAWRWRQAIRACATPLTCGRHASVAMSTRIEVGPKSLNPMRNNRDFMSPAPISGLSSSV